MVHIQLGYDIIVCMSSTGKGNRMQPSLYMEIDTAGMIRNSIYPKPCTLVQVHFMCMEDLIMKYSGFT